MNLDFSPLADLIAERLHAEFQADEVLTLQQAADLLQFHPTTVARWASGGELPGRKYGNEWRFSRRALLNHITDNAHQGERQTTQPGV